MPPLNTFSLRNLIWRHAPQKNLFFLTILIIILTYSCKNQQEKQSSSRSIPISETTGDIASQDNPAIQQVTIIADLPDSLQPETIFLANTPTPKSVQLPDKPISFPIQHKSGFSTMYVDPVVKTKASLSPVLEHFTSEQGLALDVMSCGFADSKGNLWFGTAVGGVSRYDGHSFTNYTMAHGLIDNGISNIDEDRNGNIWFSTGSGVNKFDGSTFSTFGNFKGVNDILEDKAGNFWFCSIGNGLYKYAGDSITRYTMTDGLPGNEVYHIAEDRNGKFWIGTNKGLCSFDGKKFTNLNIGNENFFTTYVDSNGNVWAGATSGYIKYDGINITRFPLPVAYNRHLFEDRLGNIWLDGHINGLWYYDGHDALNKFYNLSSGIASAEDKSGNLWFCTPANGVVKYSGPAFQQLTDNSVRSIFEDPQHNIWFSGYLNGITRFDGEYMTNFGLKVSIWCMTRDNAGNIWSGCADGEGLIKFDGKAFTYYTDLNGLPDMFPQFITQDSKGFLWIGTQKGLSRFDGKSFTNFSKKQGLAGEMVSCLLEDRPGKFYLGTNQGLTYFDGVSMTSYSISQGRESNDIRSLVKDKNGNLWMGIYGGGLCRFDGKTFYTYTTEQGLPENVVTQVAMTKEGYVVAGTNKGIALLKGFRSVSNADTNHAGDTSLNTMYPVQNNLSNHELKNLTPVFEIYNTGRGYPVMDVNRGQNAIFIDSKGIMWIASGSAKSGVMRFDYSSLYKIDNPPLVNVVGIKVNDEFVGWNDILNNENTHFQSPSKFESKVVPTAVTEEVATFGKILSDSSREAMRIKYKGVEFDGVSRFYPVPLHPTLPHSHNKLTIEFAAIEPGKPSIVQYQYKLDGYDKDWSTPAHITSATYGNIYEGTYQFNVKAKSPSGIWSEPVTYSFTVLPPLSRTWWAYGLYALLFAAMMYGILLFMRKRLELRHQLVLEHDESIRLKELDTFKSQLFTNLTHEFRTPLTVILGMANQISQGTWKSIVGEKEKNRISLGLSMIENNGKNLLQLINQLLDLSKLENKSFKLNFTQSDIVHYLRYVTESFQSYAEDLGLALRFSSPMDVLVMDFDPEQLKQIMTNLISNALKFTPPGGEVTVHLRHAEGKLDIQIRDSGIGISESDLPKVLDRFFQADSTSTRSAQGTGIGLAHTQELLQIMGGSISFDSELGKGTTVSVQLPIRHDAPVIEQEEMTLPSKPHLSIERPYSEAVSDDASPRDQQTSLNENIPQLLIIEDNHDVVAYLKSCLEVEYQIMTAYNGKAGAEIALESIPDFIISDVMMPEMDGYQVCDKLKNDERTSHIPILLLTAKADAASRLVGLRRGADAYMAKPFSPEELSLQITTLLENRRRMASYFSRALRSDTSLVEIQTSIPEAIQIEDAFIKKINAIIEAHYTQEEFSLPMLCQYIGMSRSQLFRKIKAVADISPSDMIRTYRLRKARTLLEQGDITVAEVTYKVGFKDPSYFSKLFQEEFGVMPSEIRQG